jgi:flagellar basal-body rod protein FlgC
MSLFTALDINSSGLTAQRRRVEVATSNLSNTETTRTTEGGPYRRKDVVFQTTTFGSVMQNANTRNEGVEVAGVIDDVDSPFDRRYEPGHPDADGDGYVNYPNVKPMEANIGAISIVKTMINRTLDLGK